jgi:crotonobetainyl-CoA:carnitine CoA-transferase CaiB-like acyl-CoA transferase
MAVPYLQARYGDSAPDRVGLKHPSIAPYGAFTCADGRELVLSIQNEREWVNFCASVVRIPDLATDPRFDNNSRRTANREDLEARIQEIFSELTYAQAVDRLTEAQTAFGAINSVHDLIQHPQLRTRDMEVNGRTVKVPAPPYVTDWDDLTFASLPAIGQHEALPSASEKVVTVSGAPR